MSELGQQLTEIAKKHGKEMAKEIVNTALFPALQKLAADTPNKFDDALLVALGEPLKAELIKAIDGL